QHAHVVARGAVDLESFLPGATKNVPAADHNSNLYAQRVHVLELAGDGLNRFAVNPKALRPLKRLAGKLQDDAVINQLALLHGFAQGTLRGSCFRHDSPWGCSKAWEL